MNEIEILLIEDNPTDAELILRILKKEGPDIRLEIINDGARVMQILSAMSASLSRKNKPGPKVILLDLDMPKVDGLQILSNIKSDKFTKTIPVVILTSSSNDKDIKGCYKLGANSYVVKPLDYGDFSQAVSEIVQYWLVLNQPPRF